ncbi:alpha/beta hydrolase family protein [Sphingomonas sp. PB4P5]|uniref:alpha/beta hydrolase family protein n=1 Tax=Parasphingomonas puruogangriensis TaxID=3096155 RepID=UPI002FC64835
MNNLIDKARHLPVNDAVTTISISPVILPAPGRGVPLELRITAPMNGSALPVVLLSHGHGPSLYIPSKDGYGPLANFLAEHGFVVIQPTHPNSKVGGLAPDAPGGPLFWRERVEDMTRILDQIETIEAIVPAISGRLDHGRIAAIGHSLGSHTISVLLGATVAAPEDAESGSDLREPRIKVGVLLASLGRSQDLNGPMGLRYPALGLDFSTMTTRTLVVFGDHDVSPHLTERDAQWHADPYHHGPGADCLLTLFGAKHGLGGVAGYDAKETDDEDPDRLAVVQRMLWAYLRSTLYPGDPAWLNVCKALKNDVSQIGQVDCK